MGKPSRALTPWPSPLASLGVSVWIRLLDSFLLRVEWWPSTLSLHVHLEPEALIVSLGLTPGHAETQSTLHHTYNPPEGLLG